MGVDMSPDGRGRPLVKLNRRIREPSSIYQPSRPPADGKAHQRISTHQRPWPSFRCPITWHHIHERPAAGPLPRCSPGRWSPGLRRGHRPL
jgi:hypothetical protein